MAINAKSRMRQVIRNLLKRPADGGNGVDLDYLTQLVRRYSVEQQQVPKNLLDLVSLNYLEAIPVAPPGRRFVIDRKSVEVRLV
jgi:hypothetical protein